MSEEELKPLKWEPDPNIGFTVVRRPDGGMHLTFTDVSHDTLTHWREFALSHLIDSDRLTRNLYDLRNVKEITEEAVRFAIEANSDPSARNIRMAIVVANEAVKTAVIKIASLTPASGGVEMKLFTNIDEAEAWLSRPLDLL